MANYTIGEFSSHIDTIICLCNPMEGLGLGNLTCSLVLLLDSVNVKSHEVNTTALGAETPVVLSHLHTHV